MQGATQRSSPRARGRRPGTSGAREAILVSARRQFGDRGYSRATLRAIAANAGVDARLVLHYFGSKQELFKASVQLPLDPDLIIEQVFRDGPDNVGRNAARLLLTVLDDPSRRDVVLAMLRSAVSEPAAAELIRAVLVERMLEPIARHLGGDDPELRASLVASQVVGLLTARHVVGIPPLARTSADRLARILAPVIQGFLTAELPDGPAS
jgi:AcrR family transcriptional regulator